MILTSLIPAAPGASTQPASGSVQIGKPSTPESDVALFGDVRAFAARLEALFSASPNTAQIPADAAPSSSPVSLTEDAAFAAPAPTAGQRDAAPNPPEEAAPKIPPFSAAPPIPNPVTPIRNAHTAHPSPVHPQESATAAQPSRRHAALQAHAVAPTVESSQPVQPSAIAVPQPLLPIDPPVDGSRNLPSDLQPASSHDALAATLAPASLEAAAPFADNPTGFAQGHGIPTLPLGSHANAVVDSTSSSITEAVPQSGNSNERSPSPFAANAAPPPDVIESTQPTSLPAAASRAAARPISDPAPRPHLAPASAPGNPAVHRDAPISDSSIQPLATSFAASQSGTRASSAPYTAAAPAPTTAIKIEPFATSPVQQHRAPTPQHQAPVPQPVSSNQVPPAASQSPTGPAETPASQPAASTILKAPAAAFHSSPHSADPGAVLNIFPAPLSAPPAVDTRSPQPASPPAAGSFSSQNTFAALDAPTPSAQFTHAGARHAEAGYLDPSLGWVGVRAEVSGGALHAAVVPSSPQAADILGAHLPALHAYVSQQHGFESTIDMSWQNNSNPGGGSQQSTHQDPRASTGDDRKGTMPGSASASVAQPSSFASFDAAGAPPPASGGRYISVLA